MKAYPDKGPGCNVGDCTLESTSFGSALAAMSPETAFELGDLEPEVNLFVTPRRFDNL